MNRVKKIVFLVIIAISTNLFSQTKADALKDAKIASNATLNMDFKTVLKHTLPSVLDNDGWKISYSKRLKNNF